MLKIFRFIWNAITHVRVALFNLIFIVIIASLFVGLSQEAPKAIENDTPLLINPVGILVDKSTYDPTPLDLITGESAAPPETRVLDLIRAIETAGTDSRINGIILRLDHLRGGGLSKLEEIGQALEKFKASGKPVIAYGQGFDQQQYYLASFADEIHLHNMGSVFIKGYGVYRNYMKDAIDKLHINFHVFRVGDYKDAIENFTRNDMSDASREHNTRWVTELWNRYTSKVETLRDLPEGAIEDYIVNSSANGSDALISNAAMALEAGLVDEISSLVEVKNSFKTRFGEDEEDRFKHVSLSRYLNDIAPQPSLEVDENQIGLIVAQGAIVDGQAPANAIGSSSLVELFKIAEEDYSLKALIIRIDSGGGSAFASEIIREHIEKIQASGIPVYISMGSVAASGGYWMSVPATEVWATSSTITGSIGVWGLVPNLAESFSKLGIYSDGISTSPLADVYQLDREMSESAKNYFQHSVENIYHRFINLVAEGRGLTPEDVHKIAQGRVWTGETALEIGLVDQLGSLQDLYDHISKELNLSEPELVDIVRPLTPREQFMRSLMEEVSVFSPYFVSQSADAELAREANKLLKRINQWLPEESTSGPSIHAKCIECLDLQ